MGANFYFDQMLPAGDAEARNIENSQRQLEVFTHGNKLWLGVGGINEENDGNRITVELSKSTVTELLESIERGAQYLGYIP